MLRTAIEDEGEWTVIALYGSNNEEITRVCVMDDAETEHESFRKMVRRILADGEDLGPGEDLRTERA